jgi:hypothetical protein
MVMDPTSSGFSRPNTDEIGPSLLRELWHNQVLRRGGRSNVFTERTPLPMPDPGRKIPHIASCCSCLLRKARAGGNCGCVFVPACPWALIVKAISRRKRETHSLSERSFHPQMIIEASSSTFHYRSIAHVEVAARCCTRV